MRVGPAWFTPTKETPTSGASAHAYSSNQIICWSRDSPRPPYSTGQLIPAHPPSYWVRCQARSKSRISGPSWGCGSLGTFSRSHVRTSSRKARISGDRSRSTETPIAQSVNYFWFTLPRDSQERESVGRGAHAAGHGQPARREQEVSAALGRACVGQVPPGRTTRQAKPQQRQDIDMQAARAAVERQPCPLPEGEVRPDAAPGADKTHGVSGPFGGEQPQSTEAVAGRSARGRTAGAVRQFREVPPARGAGGTSRPVAAGHRARRRGQAAVASPR